MQRVGGGEKKNNSKQKRTKYKKNNQNKPKIAKKKIARSLRESLLIKPPDRNPMHNITRGKQKKQEKIET